MYREDCFYKITDLMHHNVYASLLKEKLDAKDFDRTRMYFKDNSKTPKTYEEVTVSFNDIYEISDLQQLENVEYPVIAFINKMKLGYYEYALITGIERGNVCVQKAFKEETIVIPIDVFVNEISNIIICRKII